MTAPDAGAPGADDAAAAHRLMGEFPERVVMWFGGRFRAWRADSTAPVPVLAVTEEEMRRKLKALRIAMAKALR